MELDRRVWIGPVTCHNRADESIIPGLVRTPRAEVRRNLCGVALNLMQGWRSICFFGEFVGFFSFFFFFLFVHESRFSNRFSRLYENGEGVLVGYF